MTTASTSTPRRLAPSSLLGVVGTGVAYLLNYRVVADLGATTGVARHLHHPGRRRHRRRGRSRRAVRVPHRRRRRADRRRHRRRATDGRLPRPVPPVGRCCSLVVCAVAVLAACGGGGSGSAVRARPARALDPVSASPRPPGQRRARVPLRPTDLGPAPRRAAAVGRARPSRSSRPAQVGYLEAGGVLLQYRRPRRRRAGPSWRRSPATASPSRPTPTSPSRSSPPPGWPSRRATTSTSTRSRTFVDDHRGDGPGHG